METKEVTEEAVEVKAAEAESAELVESAATVEAAGAAVATEAALAVKEARLPSAGALVHLGGSYRRAAGAQVEPQVAATAEPVSTAEAASRACAC